jgi:hypothetical protein
LKTSYEAQIAEIKAKSVAEKADLEKTATATATDLRAEIAKIEAKLTSEQAEHKKDQDVLNAKLAESQADVARVTEEKRVAQASFDAQLVNIEKAVGGDDAAAAPTTDAAPAETA